MTSPLIPKLLQPLEIRVGEWQDPPLQTPITLHPLLRLHQPLLHVLGLLGGFFRPLVGEVPELCPEVPHPGPGAWVHHPTDLPVVVEVLSERAQQVSVLLWRERESVGKSSNFNFT